MSSTTRELRAEIDIRAPVERVWEVVTDIDAMVQGSPELRHADELEHALATTIAKFKAIAEA